ncbi:MAG: hypothetical protein JOZ73_04090 [Solirubrobacterales bacterium]|nr:hypothetical protein [Solirubrobacterales bacterium]
MGARRGFLVCGAIVASTAICSLNAGGAVAAPSKRACAAFAAHRSGRAITALERPRLRRHAPRVFVMQFKQDARYVVSYGTFETKIECMLKRYVVPRLAHGRPNLVVLGEDTGLATVATGSRGAVARNEFARPGGPSCEKQGQFCATLGALAALSAAYAEPLAVYHSRFGAFSGLDQPFIGATDTIVRSFMGTFSSLAKRYRVYMIASADLAPFRQSSDPRDVSAFADPDLHPRPASVYVATAPKVYNEVFMWGPHNVRRRGPDVLRNVVASNLKVPLTSLESVIGFSPGPASGPAAAANLRPYKLPGTRARIGFATSLPAFVWNVPPRGVDPCSDTSLYYMRCLNRLGANLVIQDDANPGRWTGPDGNGIEQWQPLSWMGSTYRTVSDRSVRFGYNVTSMMVGNLADLVFDGQSAITQRGLRGKGCHYIGNGSFVPGEDQAFNRVYAGRKAGFLALAPWVVRNSSRAALRRVGDQLAPGSGSSLQDDYLETALVADLPFPVDRKRRDCAGVRRGG